MQYILQINSFCAKIDLVIDMQRFYYNENNILVHHSIDEIPNPNDFYMHAHDYLELYYFISGKGQYIVEGTRYDLTSGDILVMMPSEAHMLQIEPIMPYERITVQFTPDIFSSIASSDLLRAFLRRPLGQLNQYHQNDFIEKCFKNMTNTRENADCYTRTLAYLLPIVYELGKAYDERSDTFEYQESSSGANNIIGFVNTNLFNDISVDSIAKHFYLSRSQINRIFKQATGKSVWEYVLIKRLLQARRRIKDGEHIGTVAISCGFKDYSAFFRAYKKQFKTSPSSDVKKSSSE